MSWQFTFDPNRCTGCGACVLGCGLEHGARQTQAWRRIHTFNPVRHPALPVFHLSLACHHCEEPACLRACPADAYTQDPSTGAVVIHPERCMGCRFCTWACPHDAPKFSASTGTIEKCTFCDQRLVEGLEPACVARCPVEALGLETRGPVEERNHAQVGLPPSALRPALRFVPHRDRLPERPAAKGLNRFLDQVLALPEAKITLRGEWALLLFTLTLQALAAWWVAMAAGGPAVRPLPFLAAGAMALLLSVAHLGHPGRAWRALLHLRTSWLSREVALVSAFLGLGAATLLLPLPEALRTAAVWAGAGLGFTALLAVDKLYRVALKTRPWNLHSARVLLGGHVLLGVLAYLPILIWGAGALKLALYVARKVHFARSGRNPRWALSVLRVAVGFLSPALLLDQPWLAAASLLAGDLVDRAEYYDELETDSPDRQMVQVARGLLEA